MTLPPAARAAVDSVLDALERYHDALSSDASFGAAAADAAAEIEAYAASASGFVEGESCTLAEVAALAWLHPLPGAAAKAAPRVAAILEAASKAGWAAEALASVSLSSSAPARAPAAAAAPSASDAAWRPDVPAGHTAATWRRGARPPLVPYWEAGAPPPGTATAAAADTKKSDKKAKAKSDKARAKAERKAKAAAKAAAAAAAKPSPSSSSKKGKAGPAASDAGAAAADAPQPEKLRWWTPPAGAARLPREGARNILVTSALPYVNNVPHLGNVVGCVLSADVYARFCRLRGHNVIYMCGTDEYGTATETKAVEEGLTPQGVCDKYHAVHRDVYRWFDISFDHFGRTTTPQQTEIAQDIFRRCDERGNVLTQTMEQLWCARCARFLADRYVEGVCPKCGYDDARGDQCDACSSLLNPSELLEPRCKFCSAPPERKEVEHLFLDLPKLTPELEAWVRESSAAGKWSANSVHTTNAWLKGGLQPRCISRDLKWGTPVPKPGFTDKVFYVWFDAPIGYISITANYTPEWRQWWHRGAGAGAGGADVQLYQFMGKDNVPFHTVIFPSSLLGTGQPWTMLHHVSTTEYLNYETGKFSKSRRTGVFGDDARDRTSVPSEVWRFYLMATRPESSDTQFDWDDFRALSNNVLLANFGNFCNRALKFTHSRLGARVPPSPAPGADEERLQADVRERVGQYVDALEAVHIRDGASHVMRVSQLGNEYLQQQQPWVLAKTDMPRCQTVLRHALGLVRVLAALAKPYMPTITDRLCAYLGGVDPDALTLDADLLGAGLAEGAELPEPATLFRSISEEEVAVYRARFGGPQWSGGEAPPAEGEEFPLRVITSTVLSAEPHPDPAAERLYVLTLDGGAAAGGEPRAVCSALREHYPDPAALVGLHAALLINIKAGKFKGVKSQGMLLCARRADGGTALLVGDDRGHASVPAGARAVPKKNFNVKKDLAGLGMVVGGAGEVLWRGAACSGGLRVDPARASEGGWEGAVVC